MNRSRLTLLLALTAFKNKGDADASKVTQITPNAATRFAFDKKGGYQQVQISNQNGPQNDGMLDVIDATYLAPDQNDVTEIDRALIVRVESTRGLDSFTAQAIAEAIESYMDQNGTSEFATAAIHDIGQGQDLHGKWNTLLFVRDYEGKWTFKNLRFASVQKSTDDTFAILRDGKIAKTDGASLVSTLLDDTKLQALIDGGRVLGGSKKKHLVRAPINQGGAYAVVDENGQTIYDDKFETVVTAQTPFLVMPAINEDGTYADGQVTTVSGKGNDWDIRPGIPASKAGDFATAYGAQAA